MAEPATGARDAQVPRLTPGWVSFLSIAAVFIALRVPSLIEPPTFNDEGTYSDIGWALDHGAVLYRDVWGHYTPGMYWLGAAINLVNTSVLAFHVVLAAAVAATALAVWLFSRRFASIHVAWAATLAFVILASLPTLEGDVLYVEVIGAALVVWAVLLVARRSVVTTRAAMVAGVIVGAAMLFKPTFVADAVAVATIPAVIAVASGRRPGHPEVRALLSVAAGAVALLGVAAVALWLGGSLPGLVDVLTHQDEAYLQSANGGGGAGVSPSGGAGLVLLVMTATRIGFVLVVGSAMTWWLARRRHLAASVAAWWLTWELAAVVVSALGLAHYAQQMEPALCVCSALLAARFVHRFPLRRLALAAVATVVAWAVCVVGLIAPTAEASLVVPQMFSTFVTSIVSPHVITHYVGGGWEHVLGVTSDATYEAGFGPQPALVRATVSIIDARTRPGDRVFVWGRVPWAYSLSQRFPAGRYTSLNSSFTLDPHAQPLLISELRARPPAVLIQLETLPLAVSALLHQLQYQPLSLANGGICWVAPSRPLP
jgi:hypothetical protein